MKSSFWKRHFYYSVLIRCSQAQSIGQWLPEINPPFGIETCTPVGCEVSSASITIDANWRPLKDLSGNRSCLVNSTWDSTLCPDPITCAKNCALGGINYNHHGIIAKHRSLNIKLLNNQAGNKGARLYFLDGKDQYKMFYLLNQEFSFDVDLSKLPCGVNGALYFSSMEPNGGKSDTNQAGARLGTGYCDAQGPTYLKFVQGKANLNLKNKKMGQMGLACPEVDILESNSISHSFTLHPCLNPSSTFCDGDTCKANGGLCDSPGCGFAPYRLGNLDFYGPSKHINTQQKIRIITQFITSDKTGNGELVEIRRLYVQNGKLIQNGQVRIPGGLRSFDSINSKFCSAVRSATNESESFDKNGGMRMMGEAIRRGMVLVASLWIDMSPEHMSWLDGNPKGQTTFGSVRGTCNSTLSKTDRIIKEHPDTAVEFSNIKIGPINSTSQS